MTNPESSFCRVKGQEESVIDMVLKTAQEQAEKVLRSPATLRFLSNPRVQKTMLQAINLRAEIRQKVTTQVEGFARNHNLVTREDVAKLRRTLREMEGTLAQLRVELGEANTRAENAQSEARSAHDLAKKPKSAENKLPKAGKRTPRKTASRTPSRTQSKKK